MDDKTAKVMNGMMDRKTAGQTDRRTSVLKEGKTVKQTDIKS